MIFALHYMENMLYGMAWNTPRYTTSRKVDDSSNLHVKWDFERLYFKDHPLTKLAPGNVMQMAHNVETWTISSSLAIIAAAKGDWLLKFSQNICLVLADDENRSPEHYAIHLDENEARSELNTIRLDRGIEDSTLAMACILDYAKMQGAPITAKSMHTWANFREAVNANDQAGDVIKKAYQQLAALMASYNIHMQQAVNEAEQGICLKPERNFGRGQRNVFAGPLIRRELADKYDGVDQAAMDDLATKLTRAVAIDISAMRAADVDNWLLTIHSCILALRQRKTLEEVIESATTAPVLENSRVCKTDRTACVKPSGVPLAKRLHNTTNCVGPH